jgi:hypothetical protein
LMPEISTPAITLGFGTFTSLSPRDALTATARSFFKAGRTVSDPTPCKSELGKIGRKITILGGIETGVDFLPTELEVRTFSETSGYRERAPHTFVEMELRVDGKYLTDRVQAMAVASEQIESDLEEMLIAFDSQKAVAAEREYPTEIGS